MPMVPHRSKLVATLASCAAITTVAGGTAPAQARPRHSLARPRHGAIGPHRAPSRRSRRVVRRYKVRGRCC